MNLTTFLNNRFEEVTRKMAQTEFSTLKHAENEALQLVLKSYFFILKMALVPKVIAHYALVTLRVIGPPRPALQEAKIEYEAAKREATLNQPHIKQLRKSFQPSPKEPA